MFLLNMSEYFHQNLENVYKSVEKKFNQYRLKYNSKLLTRSEWVTSIEIPADYKYLDTLPSDRKQIPDSRCTTPIEQEFVMKVRLGKGKNYVCIEI